MKILQCIGPYMEHRNVTKMFVYKHTETIAYVKKWPAFEQKIQI